MREEHRFRVFENKAFGNKFGAKREEDTGERRKLHGIKLNEFYPSPNIRVIRNI